MRASGLQIPAFSTSRRSVMDHEKADENLAYSHRAIDACAAIGIPVVNFGFMRGFTPAQAKALWFWLEPGYADDFSDDVRSVAVGKIKELAKHAQEVGVQIALEMYEDTYLGTADRMVQFVQDVGYDNVGLNPDFGNILRLHREVEPWEEIAAKTFPYTNYWHLKNYYRDEEPSTGSVRTHPAPLEFGTSTTARPSRWPSRPVSAARSAWNTTAATASAWVRRTASTSVACCPRRPRSSRSAAALRSTERSKETVQMTKIFGDPANFVDESVAGFVDLYSHYVQPVPHGVIRSTATPEGKVAVIAGGGSGHYPAFAGYVGPGLPTAPCAATSSPPPPPAGSTTSPRPPTAAAASSWASATTRGHPQLRPGRRTPARRSIPAELLVVTDDVASEGQGANGQRRGIAGDVVAFKIAGAAAEAGYAFDDVVRAARHANDVTRSMGIAFAGCTLPGENEPLFTVTEAHGRRLGIHGEPGISEEPIGTPEEIATLLVDKVLAGRPDGAPDVRRGTVAVLVNGPRLDEVRELFLLYVPIAASCAPRVRDRRPPGR